MPNKKIITRYFQRRVAHQQNSDPNVTKDAPCQKYICNAVLRIIVLINEEKTGAR